MYVDKGHTPHLLSSMLRVPNSTNSKNGVHVSIEKEWDGQRPLVADLFEPFIVTLHLQKRKMLRYGMTVIALVYRPEIC
jgi:hypothetical protein